MFAHPRAGNIIVSFLAQELPTLQDIMLLLSFGASCSRFESCKLVAAPVGSASIRIKYS
jgi:hypothetical protein